MFSLIFFSTAAHFHHALVAARISHFLIATTKFSFCSSNKKGLLCFISHYISQLPFFSLSFAGLPPTFSFSLSFTCSIFQICGHDIQSSVYLVVLQLIPLSSVHSKNAFSAFYVSSILFLRTVTKIEVSSAYLVRSLAWQY